MADAIEIGDPAIEIRLRRNARARRMVLRVAQTGRGPTLTLPPGVPLAQARAFLSDQEGWLRRHLTARPRGEPVRDGSVLPFGDDTLTIRAHEHRTTKRAGAVLLVPGAAEQHAARVAAWLREQARVACVAGVDRYAARLRVSTGRITLRDPRSRWGSCTASGDLMFSWRLVMAPVAVLDYVVAHEVAHLVEMNHSSKFWTVVRSLCPDDRGPRDWLRQNGAALHSHDFGRA